MSCCTASLLSSLRLLGTNGIKAYELCKSGTARPYRGAARRTSEAMVSHPSLWQPINSKTRPFERRCEHIVVQVRGILLPILVLLLDDFFINIGASCRRVLGYNAWIQRGLDEGPSTVSNAMQSSNKSRSPYRHCNFKYFLVYCRIHTSSIESNGFDNTCKKLTCCCHCEFSFKETRNVQLLDT